MAGVSAWLRSFVDATVDVGLSVLGLLLVLAPTVSAMHGLLGEPIAQHRLELAVLIVAVALAYPFANRLLSQGWLGTYVLAFCGGLIGIGVLSMVAIAETGISLSGQNPLWPALVMALSHAIALTVVYLDDVQLSPRRNGGTAG